MENAASMRDTNSDYDHCVNLNTLLLAVRGRHSSNPIDKVCVIAFPFQKHPWGSFQVTLPIYDPSTPVSVAWERLISIIASTRVTIYDKSSPSPEPQHSPTIQLLCLFPHPSRHHWFPSWAQLQQYPNVSFRDNDPVTAAGDIDYSLPIRTGRIYHGCSLKLKQAITSEEKAAYHCSIGSKSVELVATVPGIEVNFDSRTTYVLVDISPDTSVGSFRPCLNVFVGHVHLPMWQKSVVIVCEEVDTLAQLATHSPAILAYRYRLRRITTLEWDCRTGEKGRGWLPFGRSLEHMKSLVCSAEGGHHYRNPPSLVCSAEGGHHYRNPPDVFCDPAAVTGLPIRTKSGYIETYDWDKCPRYKVYLV